MKTQTIDSNLKFSNINTHIMVVKVIPANSYLVVQNSVASSSYIKV